MVLMLQLAAQSDWDTHTHTIDTQNTPCRLTELQPSSFMEKNGGRERKEGIDDFLKRFYDEKVTFGLFNVLFNVAWIPTSTTSATN